MATETEKSDPGSLSLEIQTDNVQSGNNGWSSGIFDCFDDDDSCLMAFCVPCILFGYNYEIISKNECDCVAGGLLYTLLLSAGLQWMLAASARSDLRHMLNLSGSTEHDYFVHFFFHWCALAQEYRELTSHGFIVEDGYTANKTRMEAEERARQLRATVVTGPEVQAQMDRNA